jgi:(3,5-dihydroxyphenyl)acetyl-CoA 1,2-dioxygenase
MEKVIENVCKVITIDSDIIKSGLLETLKNLNNWIKKTENTFLNKSTGSIENIDIISFQRKLAKERGRIVQVFGIEIYASITDNWTKMFRVEKFLYLLSDQFPGLAPTREEVQNDSKLNLVEKKGYEISQGILLSNFLAHSEIGFHLMEAMRLPKEESLNRLSEFEQKGELQLSVIKLVRTGNIAHITISNLNFLNSEDDILNNELETIVDLCLLDSKIDLIVMRGDFMKHEKYKNRRVFCSGVNLTKLYYGDIPFTFYIERELGLMSKILRGLYSEEFSWEHGVDNGIEKPFITIVDTHAIGGGCQMVLISDVVIAASDSYFTIPARTEGFIPGVANFRIQRFMGQRLARKMINFNHKIEAKNPEGLMIADIVVDSSEIDSSLTNVINDICLAGVQGMISNRKAFRIGAESVNNFRRYMTMFSEEQVVCMYNEKIIENLERIWIKNKIKTKLKQN